MLTQRGNFSAWFVDSLVKVFPDSSAAASKVELALVSARNGHTSLQVALRSESHRVVRVRVIAPRLGSATLMVQTYRVGTMESARRDPARTDALARTAMRTFTEYVRDVSQFRKIEREMLALAAEAQKKR
jgi:hypothetical protein